MITQLLADKVQIQAYLETDRDYAAYALGDLDVGFFEQCTWQVAKDGSTVCALALVYAGFDPPVLFLMGSGDGVAALLAGPVQARRVFVTARPEHLAVLERYYHWEHLDYMWRMVLRPKGLPKPQGSCKRLDENDVDRLRALYVQSGGGDAFNSSQVTQGVFYGIEQAGPERRDGQLISVAGTHLVSQTYSVGAIGNVVTHPDCRGRGYATSTTQAVCDELMRSGRRIHTIVLNVRQDNAPAIRVYENLGFVRYCPYYEGVIERR